MANIDSKDFPKLARVIQAPDCGERLIVSAICSRLNMKQLQSLGEEEILRSAVHLTLAADIAGLEGHPMSIGDQVDTFMEIGNHKLIGVEYFGTRLMARCVLPLVGHLYKLIRGPHGSAAYTKQLPREILLGIAILNWEWIRSCLAFNQDVETQRMDWEAYFFNKDEFGMTRIDRKLLGDLVDITAFITQLEDELGAEYALSEARARLNLDPDPRKLLPYADLECISTRELVGIL